MRDPKNDRNLALDSAETPRVDKILRDLGFKPEAPESTARALVLNLIRNAYGEEAARLALSEWNRSLDSISPNTEFDKSSQNSGPPAETQLSFFDEASDLKKSS